MKINNNILYIPPYISTTWSNVQALTFNNNLLKISLANDTLIEIPNLNAESLELIFAAHAEFLENQPLIQKHTPPSRLPHPTAPPLFNSKNALLEDSTLTFGLSSFDSLGTALHHNENQANMPELPQEILSKISSIAKIVAPEDSQSLPKPEPHCNCTHCQIARAVQLGLDNENTKIIHQTIPIEEEISDTDLNFQQWDIEQKGEKIFSVSNRLDSNDKYNVYLGTPVGCTCGKDGCEHILAVLKS